jgi:diacylglycerol kinase family enzyme
MLRATPIRIDLGRVSLTTEAGDPVLRHFVNVASVGLSGLVDRAMTPALRRLGGKLGFFAATVRVVARAEPPELAIELDGVPFAEGRFGVVTVANGRFAGGGMRFAPEAALDDGRLDVTALGGRGMSSLLAHAPALYRGTIAQRGHVLVRNARSGRIFPLRGSEAWIDVDGECPGGGALAFEVVPHAIGLVGLA